MGIELKSQTYGHATGAQKVLILGGGVIGVSLAYYLSQAGHEVTVVERQPGVGLETSFANAGEVSPGYSSPWAGPGVPLKALKWMSMKHSPLVVKPSLDPYFLRWMFAMLRNCTQARYEENKSRMVRLAEYSRDQLKLLRQNTGIQYDERTLGTLQVFRTQKQLDGVANDTDILDRYGVPYEVLDRQGCLRVEPGLTTSAEQWVGGLRLTQDETGDCWLFTQRLAEMAKAQGVRFLFETAIERLHVEKGEVRGVHTSQGLLTADSYVCALGSYSPLLLRPWGIDLPVYPVKGFSITVPVRDEAKAPLSTVMDETHKVAITRLGSRIRVGGTAQLSGYDLGLVPERQDTLSFVLEDCFRGAGDFQQLKFWTGLRPMTPDGTPLVGASPLKHLWLATGHGTLGWTMAAGTGRVLADLLSGRQPDIDMSGFDLSRYG